MGAQEFVVLGEVRPAAVARQWNTILTNGEPHESCG